MILESDNLPGIGKNDLMPASQSNLKPAVIETSIFLDPIVFKQMERVAEILSKSNFIPDSFKNKIGDCMIALDLAYRMKVSPIMLMQTMYTVYGRPGFEAKLLSALINASGRYKDKLQYEWKGEKGKQDWGCRAWAVSKKTGIKIFGPWIDWQMVVAERWNQPKKSRTGGPPIPSKWVTMPEMMFMYRAASWFCNVHDSDLKMGMQTIEEIIDIESREMIKNANGIYTYSEGEKPPDLYLAENIEQVKESKEASTIKTTNWEPLSAQVKTRYFTHEKTILANMATERGMDVAEWISKNDYTHIHQMILSSATGVPLPDENAKQEEKPLEKEKDKEQDNSPNNFADMWLHGDREAARHACIICDCQRTVNGFKKPENADDKKKWMETYSLIINERTQKFNNLWNFGHQSAKDYACEKSDCDLTPNGHFKQPSPDKVSMWISNYNAFCNTHGLSIQEQSEIFDNEK